MERYVIYFQNAMATINGCGSDMFLFDHIRKQIMQGEADKHRRTCRILLL